jgi:hypothetical protein
MVNADGQLYTIEGFAASLILLLTAYLVVNSTSVYTPGDAHISDMQLETIGSDALNMMNYVANTSPDGKIGKSPLQKIVEFPDSANQTLFMVMFDNITNNRTSSSKDRIHFTANYSYVRGSLASPPSGNPVDTTTHLGKTRSLTGGEHAVRVTKWVIADVGDPPGSGASVRKRAVLVEVLLWRD